MNLSNTEQRWGLVAQAFHWLMFLLIVGAWFAVESREELAKEDPMRNTWMMVHKSIGLSVFFLVWFRIAARFSMPTPAGRGSAVQQKIGALVALGLYALMIAIPLTGMLASMAYGKPVSWFGVFELPALIGENRDLGEGLKEVHETGFGALLALLALHVAGALKHHFVDKDDVLKRMLPWGK